MNNYLKQEWAKNESDKLVDMCAKATMESASQPVDAFGFQCSSKAAVFVYCMWRELFLLCPIDKQQNTKRCSKMREVLKKFDDNKFKNI